MINLVTNNWSIVGVCYRLYPGGVECEITYQDETGFETAKAFCQAAKDQIESYNRELLSHSALTMAIEIMLEQLHELQKAISNEEV